MAVADGPRATGGSRPRHGTAEDARRRGRGAGAAPSAPLRASRRLGIFGMGGVPRRATLALALAAVGATSTAGAAGAATYCVGPVADPGVCSGAPADATPAALQAALDSAEATPQPDTVLIGPGTYVAPTSSGFSYNAAAVPGNSVDISGAGAGATILTQASTAGIAYVLDVGGPTGDATRVRGLSILIPAPADPKGDRGLYLSNGRATALSISGPDATRGIGMTGGSVVLEDSTVSLPTSGDGSTIGVAPFTGPVTVRGSHLTAMTGGLTSVQPLTVERSRVAASTTGVRTQGAGPLEVTDSLVTITGAGGVGLAVDQGAATSGQGVVRGTTVAGPGSGVGIGATAVGASASAALTVRDTAVGGFAADVRAAADDGATATVDLQWSAAGSTQTTGNLDGTGATGSASVISGPGALAAPVFADPASGDFRPAAGSALVDAGDPGAPAPGALDLAGAPRASAGTCGGAARRDIGAFEHVPQCGPGTEGGAPAPTASSGDGPLSGPLPAPPDPLGAAPGRAAGPGSGVAPDTRIVRAPRRVVRGRAVLRLAATVPGARFRCRVNGGAVRPCRARAVVTGLRRGRNVVRAWAVSPAGAVDTTPATARIVRLGTGPRRA